MQTNFFSNIASLQLQGNFVITIEQLAAEHQVISILYKNNKCGDSAADLIQPLIFNGTPSKADDEFFTAIRTPIKDQAGLLINMEQHLKSVELAKQESQMEKAKIEKEKKEREEQKKKYDTIMKKVEDLEKEEKYKEAWAKIPDPADFPDKADEIRKRKDELYIKFGQPNLF